MASAPRLKQALAMTHPDHPNSASLLTRTDYEQYRAQLDELRRVRDRDLPELLRDARGFVASDAEEEIAQIRDDHVFVEARIARLEALLRDAHVVADSEAPDVAFPGRVVDVEYTRSGKRATYRIASAGRRCPPGHRVRRLAGRPGPHRPRPGDLVSVELPNGRGEELRIVAVRRDDEASRRHERPRVGDARHRRLALRRARPRQVHRRHHRAFLAAVAGALVAGYLLPSPGVPADNPPGFNKAIWPIPGAVLALALLYAHGARRERKADGASS